MFRGVPREFKSYYGKMGVLTWVVVWLVATIAFDSLLTPLGLLGLILGALVAFFVFRYIGIFLLWSLVEICVFVTFSLHKHVDIRRLPIFRFIIEVVYEITVGWICVVTFTKVFLV